MRQQSYAMNKPVAYLDNYEKWFAALRDQTIRLLELGVDRGGSLLLWRDYFLHGAITGLDASLPLLIGDTSGRVQVYQGMQEDTTLLDRIGRERGPFDVIIDDCSHIAKLTRMSFWHLFERHLQPGGLYIIEDWGTGYWDSWPDGSRDHDSGMVALVKDLVDECGAVDFKAQGPVYVDNVSQFERMHISFGQVLIEKKGRLHRVA